MATLRDCVTNAPDTGVCDIDIEKAVRLFDKHCFISKWTGDKVEYRLVRMKCGRVISSPCYVRTDDMRKPLFQAERIVKEAHEDDIALSNPDFAQKMAFEFANCSNVAKDVYVFSLVVLNISNDTLMNYVMSGDFPVGKLDNPALISRFNKLYPHLGVTNIALAPHIK